MFFKPLYAQNQASYKTNQHFSNLNAGQDQAQNSLKIQISESPSRDCEPLGLEESLGIRISNKVILIAVGYPVDYTEDD